MESLFFLASVIGIGLVMWWVKTTVRAGRENAADIGMFAMRVPPVPREAAGGRTLSRP